MPVSLESNGSEFLNILLQKYVKVAPRHAKSMVFRLLANEVTAAFQYGHTRQQIWNALRAAGYSGSYSQFCRAFAFCGTMATVTGESLKPKTVAAMDRAAAAGGYR